MAKLLVSDYDDTLFTDEVSLIKNIEKIKKFQEQGNCFVIATSRSFTSIMEEVKKYQIPFDYIFSNMGAGIFDADGKILYSEFIPKEEKDKIEKGTKILVDACEENLLAWGLGKKENGKFEIGENSISDYQVLEADSPIEVYGYKIAIDDYEEFNKFIQSVTYENGLYNYIDYGQFLRVNGYYEQGSTETSNAVFENMMEASILTAYENGTINSYVENEFYTNDLNNTNKNR